MKALILFCSMVIASCAIASNQFPNGYTKVDELRMDDYKKAINSALAKTPDVISGCDARWVHDVKTYVGDILVQDQSAQPLLIYNTYFLGNVSTMHRLIFTTDVTLKNIVKVDAEIYKWGEINEGDLGNPIIVEDYVRQGLWNCQKR
jgi:hypothetical protein